jgi:DNA-binding XRE family transcriptional regulator
MIWKGITVMKYSKKLYKVLAFANWTQDHLADLLDVSTPTMNSWVNGKSEPQPKHAAVIDQIYTEIVEPVQCDLECRADAVEKKLLRCKIKDLPKNNVC